MKKYRYIISTCILMCTMILFCSVNSDKIPITTSSEEALKNFIKGRDLIEIFKNDEAREYFEDAIKADSEFASAYLLLAFTQNSTESFLELVEKATSLSENISEGEKIQIAITQAAISGETNKQEQLAIKLRDLYPRDERTHTLLATFYYGQQNYEKAIEEYKKSIQNNVRYSPPYNMLGYTYRNLGDYENAEKSFGKYIELIPNNPNPYDSYAELKMKMGDYGLSIESYYKALEIDPTFVPSHIGIANNLNFLGKHGDARDQLREMYDLVSSDADHRAALTGIALSHVDEGNLQAAIETLEKRYEIASAINDIGNMNIDLRTMARIFLEMGQLEQAESKFTEAISIVNQSDYSMELKGNTNRDNLFFESQLALARNDLESAKSKLEDYRNIARKFASIIRTRTVQWLTGIIALYEKDYNLAIEELNLANLRNTYNLYRIALAYDALGQTQSAIEMLDSTINYNSLSNLNHSFIRNKALIKLESLKTP